MVLLVPYGAMAIRPMEWTGDSLRMLDQRRLPHEESWLVLGSSREVAEAIREMAVRGAPAIGIAAAYGIVLAALHNELMEEAYDVLRASRPTAVNLFWALDRLKSLPDQGPDALLQEALTIEREDLATNQAIGRFGAGLITQGARILTICNTGSLATSGHGTALGMIRTAHSEGKGIFVYSAETRPRQQGLRLTAWELLQDGIPFASIADSAAGALMRAGKIDLVVAGADRIAANGDAANKIGTYTFAVLAHHHGLPFFIAAPTSTIDFAIATGSEIIIEERSAAELTEIEGIAVAPRGTPVYNPAFDVTPGELITAIVTDEGVFRPPYDFKR